MLNTKTLAKYRHPGVEIHDGKSPRTNYSAKMPPKAWRIADTTKLKFDDDGNVIGLYAVKMSADGETPKLKDGKPYLAQLPPYPAGYIASFNLAATSHDTPDAPNTAEADDVEMPLVIPDGYELAVPNRAIDGDAFEGIGIKVTVRKIGAVAPVESGGSVPAVDIGPLLRAQEIGNDRLAYLITKVEELLATK